jgi:inorganic pyrophosphatase
MGFNFGIHEEFVMSVAAITAGRAVPDDVNVIIEIPAQGGSIKYEVDKDSGLLMVDRFMPVAMHYPCNYGFVPHTLADDGDPVDVLVMTPYPVYAGAMMRVRPVGILWMTDEAGKDSKVLAVPIEKACAEYASIKTLDDVSSLLRDRIVHFFEHYKALEPNKWVKVDGWGDAEAAAKEILSGIEAYNNV